MIEMHRLKNVVIFIQSITGLLCAGARQMLNSVNQNREHARKHTAILQVMITWRNYINATYPKVT